MTEPNTFWQETGMCVYTGEKWELLKLSVLKTAMMVFKSVYKRLNTSESAP